MIEINGLVDVAHVQMHMPHAGFLGHGHIQAIIIRELPCGSQIAIRVNLNRALTNPGERILIQPKDVVLLKYTLGEEVGNVFLSLIQFNFLWGLGGNGFNR